VFSCQGNPIIYSFEGKGLSVIVSYRQIFTRDSRVQQIKDGLSGITGRRAKQRKEDMTNERERDRVK
jgi:hypothetical protein